jgi:hypothetical protein
MSSRLPFPAAATAAAVALTCAIFFPGRAAAQQDTGSMAHDSAMAMPMAHDSAMMSDSSMMSHDSMGHDSMSMSHDSMKMDHGMSMGAGSMMFTGAGGREASGDYSVSAKDGKPQLALTDRFAVSSAPDLNLVLGSGPTPGKDALWVGKLKRATGAQTYDLPKGKDLSRYSTLLVWSKKEKRAVASAEWHAPAGAMERQ